MVVTPFIYMDIYADVSRIQRPLVAHSMLFNPAMKLLFSLGQVSADAKVFG